MSLVTIVIPCFQERAFIRSCLESVAAFELPPNTTVEILVVDGMSSDGTSALIAEMAESDSRIQLLDNVNRTQSSALNLAISLARGEYILRLDAHSLYPSDYLVHTVETARRTNADNTGGIVRTLRRGGTYQARLVQALITHAFGVGNSGFRTGASEGPADTVPYGCFRTAVFDRVGKFDERLIRAQDYEMNRRIVASGGTVWRNPQICIDYYPPPDLKSFLRKQLLSEAPYNAYMWYLAPYSFAPRHAITALFSAGIILSLILAPISRLVQLAFFGVMGVYLALALISGLQQAIRYREPRHVLVLPPSFFLYHFTHGVGVLAGLGRLALGIAPVQKTAEPWPGAGRFRAFPSSSPQLDAAATPSRG